MSGKLGIKNTSLLLLSAVLFTLSFPSFVNTDGFPLLAYFVLLPAFFVTYKIKFIMSPFYGFFLGLISYALFNFWLLNFHPLTMFIIPPLYAAYYLALFPALRLSNTLFLRKSYIVNTIIWVGYEYLRTKGFIGYSYGLMGYSQYSLPLLVGLSSLTGIWGISFLVVFPSAFVAQVLFEKNSLPLGKTELSSELPDKIKFSDKVCLYLKNFGYHFKRVCLREKWVLAVYCLLFALSLIYSKVSQVDTSTLPVWRVALIQQNIDPWQGGDSTYRESLTRLKRLSLEAMKESPQIVVWSETSFVPAIDWHTRYRRNPKRYALVKELKDFIASQPVPYVIGNGEGIQIIDENGNEKRVDYNAALFFKDGKQISSYRKMHLVPFTEHFPYEKQFPWLYQLLEDSDTHFWEKGTEFTVFESDGVKFSTPICFEDTFGYISRNFVNAGADVIVNMTNDSWSGSVAAEAQHMTSAIFRAAENRRSLVRSTNGGITCVVDPNGRIIERIAPFEEAYLVADVPVYREGKTIYRYIGDLLGIVAVVVAVLLLVIGAAFRVFRKKMGGNK